MRLRHLNFCAALLATVRAKISRALSSPWRFEGAFHFWRANSFCEEKEPCAPLRLLQGFYSLTSQKYHFFGVDVARLFFIFYPQKNITIFEGRYRSAKSNLRPSKIIPS